MKVGNDDSPLESPGSVPAPAGRQNRLVAFLAVVLFLLPLVYRGLRQEVAKWCQAAALDATLDNDAARVIAWSRRGLAWDEENLPLRNQLMGWQAADQSPEDVIAEIDQIVELARVNFSQDSNATTAFQLASALKNSAYVRALAKLDLAVGEDRVTEAIEILPGGNDIALVSMLDARGYVRFLRGELTLADDDLDLAVQLAKLPTELHLASLQRDGQLMIDQRPIEYERLLADYRMGVLYWHRGLVRDALGRSDEAKSDFQEAKERGYDPETEEW